MVDTIPVQGDDHFIAAAADVEDCDLNTGQLSELYELWQSYQDEHGDRKLVLIPDWFSENEFDTGRRPYFFATVEHDDPDSGAVLWSNGDLIDISVIENEALESMQTFDDSYLEACTEALDISDDDEYIDDAGKTWVPRSIQTVFEDAGR